MNIKEMSLDELYLDPNNVRLHDDHNIESIKGSLVRFGQQKNIIIDEKGIILAGNGTYTAAKSLGWKTLICNVSTLESFEKMAFALADNRTSELATWDMPRLQEQLKLIKDPELIGFDDDFTLIDDERSENKEENNSDYSNKIEIPIYEPTGPKPDIKDIYNSDKTKILIENINKSSIPKDEKEFLIHAASRHIEFNYQNIAEYYAHSDKNTQLLFEESVLVLIDFNKAMELGFIKVTMDIGNLYKEESEIK